MTCLLLAPNIVNAAEMPYRERLVNNRPTTFSFMGIAKHVFIGNATDGDELGLCLFNKIDVMSSQYDWLLATGKEFLSGRDSLAGSLFCCFLGRSKKGFYLHFCDIFVSGSDCNQAEVPIHSYVLRWGFSNILERKIVNQTKRLRTPQKIRVAMEYKWPGLQL